MEMVFLKLFYTTFKLGINNEKMKTGVKKESRGVVRNFSREGLKFFFQGADLAPFGA